MATGTPEKLVRSRESHAGTFLHQILKKKK